tara:strand:+ start:36395 stop:37528 length:1134 start_codon:yes stop_codon:yes gene_type:complete
VTVDRLGSLRALERRVRRRIDARAAVRRVWESLPAILQILAGIAASYSIAHWGLGHQLPVLAVTVVVTSLGFSRDARPRRVAASVLAILLGIALANAFMVLLGAGLWQLLVAMLVTFVVARAVSPNPAFALATAIPAALVVLLPQIDGSPFGRTLDGLVGGVVALLVTALIPRDPRRQAARDGRRVFSVFDEALGSVRDALADADPAAAELALARLRRTQPLLDEWAASADTAVSVTRLSPFLRRHLVMVRRQQRLQATADLASRHLRLVARRIEFLVRDGVPRPALAGLVADLSGAMRLLATALDARTVVELEIAESARGVLSSLAARLDPAVSLPGALVVTDATVLLLLRPLVVDLLVGAGMPIDEARKLLPPVS